MSNFVANAYVQIRPETRGFESALRSQVKTAVDRVTSKVLITPSTTGFQGALRTQVRDAITKIGPQSVPVIPKVVAAGEVQAALSEQKLKVPLVPDFTNFQKEITARIQAINAALPPVEVPVGAVDVGDVTGEVKARKDAEAASRSAADAKRREAQASQQLTRQQQLEIAAKERVAAQDKIIAPLKRSLVVSSVQLTQAINAQAGSEAQLAGLEASRKTLMETLERTEVALREATGATNVELRKRLTTIREQIISEAQLVNQEIKSAAASSADASATKKAAVAAFEHSRAMQIEFGALRDVAAIREANIVLKEAETAVTKALEAARKVENVTLIDQLVLMESELAARRGVITAQQAQMKSQVELARQQELLTRGAGSTGLSLLGVRGATLAASAEFLVGAAAVAAFAKSISATANLEKELNVFAVTAKATATELALAGEEARKLGADVSLPAVSAGDAAQAFSELSKAGLDVQQSIAGARGVLQLATAAEIDNAQATELVASALNAFSLEGAEAVRVADLLAGASIEAQGNIADMGVALQQSAAAARQAGISLEDTVALLTLLARNGLRGSDAGTSLRTALIRLINPTTKAQKLIKELGVNIRDVNGNIRPEVFADFTTALEGSTKAQRDQTLAILFGQDAFRSAAILGREASAGLDAAREATQESGLAAELAGARAQGFAGQVEALKNQLNTLGTEIGTATIPLLGRFVDAGSEIAKAFGRAADALERFEDSVPTGDDESGAGGFFKKFAEGVTQSTGDMLRDIEASAQLLDASLHGRETGTFLPTGAFEQVQKLNAELAVTADNATKMSNELGKIERAGGSTEELVGFLRDLKSDIIGNSDEAERLRARFDQIVRAVVALGRAPTAVELEILFKEGGIPEELSRVRRFVEQLPPITFGANVDLQREQARQEAEKAAQETADRFKTFFGNVLSPAVAQAIGFDFMTNVGIGGENAADEAGSRAGDAFTQSLNTALSVAVAEGDENAELRILQEQLRRTRRRRARLEERFEERPGKKLDEGIRKQAEEESRLQGEIERIQKDRAQRAKDSASAIQKSRDDADKAFLDAIGVSEGSLRQRELEAAATTGLKDDIAANRALQKFFTDQITRAQTTLRDALTRTQTVQALTKQLTQLQIEGQRLSLDLQEQLMKRLDIRIDIAEAKGDSAVVVRLLREKERALRDAIKEARKLKDTQRVLELELELINTQEQVRETILEGLRLDIEFANIQGNASREIAARTRLIAVLKKQQSLVRKGTAEWKRLRNEIAQEQKAIKELRGEVDDEDATSAFELLQQNAETFARIAGDLTNFNQPFGEVSDFTVDLAALLTRRPGAKAGGKGAATAPEVRAAKSKQDERDRSIERLIAALEQNTAALTGGDPKKKGKTAGPNIYSGAVITDDNRWVESGKNRSRGLGRV